MVDEYDELPIDPDEATDLRVHVKACVRRFAALLRKLDNMDEKQDRLIAEDRRRKRRGAWVTTVYRAVVVSALTGLCGVLFKVGERFFAW